GEPSEAVSLLHSLVGEDRELPENDEVVGQFVLRGGAEVESLELLGPDGRATHDIESGSDVTLRAVVRFDRPCIDPVFSISIYNQQNISIYTESTISTKVGTFA